MPKLSLPIVHAVMNQRTVYSTKDEAATDCSYCRSPCCQLLVQLQGDEPSRFESETKVVGGKEGTYLKRNPDGYCVYYVHGTGCSTYEEKPWVCDFYSCRSDGRITSHKKYGKVEPME